MTYKAALLAGLSWSPIFPGNSRRPLGTESRVWAGGNSEAEKAVSQQITWASADSLRIKDTPESRGSQEAPHPPPTVTQARKLMLLCSGFKLLSYIFFEPLIKLRSSGPVRRAASPTVWGRTLTEVGRVPSTGGLHTVVSYKPRAHYQVKARLHAPGSCDPITTGMSVGTTGPLCPQCREQGVAGL